MRTPLKIIYTCSIYRLGSNILLIPLVKGRARNVRKAVARQLLIIHGSLAHTSLFNEHFSRLLSGVLRNLTEFLRYWFKLRSLRPKVDLPDGVCQELSRFAR